MAKRRPRLPEGHVVLAAWAEPADGPGWANQPVWALTRNTWDGSYHLHCLQPEEQSRDIATLYQVSAAAHAAMTAAVEAAFAAPRKRG